MKLEISWVSANAVTTRSTRLTKFGLINWELLFSISWLNPRWLMDSMIILCSVRINSLIMQ